MADVRSMLRSELASRKAATSSAPSTSKKRKHVSEDTPDRKRARNEDTEPATNPQDKPSDDRPEEVDGTPTVSLQEAENTDLLPQQKQSVDDTIDEDEWARFEREMAGIQSSSTGNALAALTAQPAAEAAPLSAEEIAKQARVEMSAQKGAKDVEGEEEKEDEARRIEDEFEEMEALENRVKKLRERREALRRGSPNTADQGGDVSAGGETTNNIDADSEDSKDGSAKPAQDESASDDGSQSDSEEDEWANWGRRR